MRPGRTKSCCSTETSPVIMSTGSARRILHLRKPGFIFPKSFLRMRLNSFDFANLPSAAKPSLNAIPISDMVGGPPMNTFVGIARLVTVGSNISFFSFFLIRGGLIMPATWQLNTGTDKKENGSPSATTVALPMKISSFRAFSAQTESRECVYGPAAGAGDGAFHAATVTVALRIGENRGRRRRCVCGVGTGDVTVAPQR